MSDGDVDPGSPFPAWLFPAIGGVFLLGVALFGVLQVADIGAGTTPVSRIASHCEVRSALEEQEEAPSGAEQATPPEPAGGIAIYVDVSQPMGGFVRFEGNEDLPFTAFEHVLRNVHSHLAASLSLSDESAVTWHAVDHRVSDKAGREQFERQGDFTGTQSHLRLAVEQAARRVETGELAVAAVITDLVATGDTDGGGDIARFLRGWLDTDTAVRGELGVAVLGIRSTYYGLHKGPCSHAKGCGDKTRERECGGGCRLSELERSGHKWMPLETPGPVPFYVLLLGRDAVRVAEAAFALGSDPALASRERLLGWVSERSRPRSASMSCLVGGNVSGEAIGGPSPLYVAKRGGKPMCLMGRAMGAACSLTFDLPAVPSGLVGDPAPAVRTPRGLDARTTWSERFRLDGSPVADDGNVVFPMVVDCSIGSTGPIDTDLAFTFEVGAEPPDTTWRAWNTTEDRSPESLGRTLHLSAFFENLAPRPDRYVVTCGRPLFCAGDSACGSAEMRAP